MAVAEDELICDFAQYYGIYNYMTLPAATAATLAAGLPKESRVKRGPAAEYSLTELLLAAVADEINILLWMQTKNGQKGRNKPGSILERMIEKPQEKPLRGFNTIEEFEKYRAKITAGGDNIK